MSRKTRRRFRKGTRPGGPPAPRASAPQNAPLQDDVLRAAEQKIESQLLPQNRADYMRVVVAGMQAGLAGGPNSILASVRKSPDPVRDCALGAVGLVLSLRLHSRLTMPVQAMVPAGMTLMLHALDFVNRLGLAKVGAPELARATHLYGNTIMAKFGVTPQKFAALVQRVHGMTQDPTTQEMLARRIGLVKSPLASTPTELPQGEGAPQ